MAGAARNVIRNVCGGSNGGPEGPPLHPGREICGYAGRADLKVRGYFGRAEGPPLLGRTLKVRRYFGATLKVRRYLDAR
jgi:hypothetical protein